MLIKEREKLRIRKIPFDDMVQWLSLRIELGIGGSEAAAVARLSKWETPLSVYSRKLGLIDNKEDNEQMRQGRDFEEYVAQRFCEQTGKKVRRENHILVNEDLPFMYANIDRKVVGEDAGLECKTTSPFNKADFDDGDIPETYYVQCQHYMAVTGYQYWYLAVLILNQHFYVFKIQRNEDDIESLIEMERNFWYENVMKQVPPEPLEHDADLLAQLYSDVDYGAYIPLDHLSPIFERLDYVKDQIKRLESEKKTLENDIKQSMGEATEAGCGSYQIAWRPRTSNRIDTTRLKKEKPEIYKQYLNESTSRYFVIKKEKTA